MKNLVLHFSLGFIGHKAIDLQSLFSEYTPTPNENGFFLYFEDFSELVNNQGVLVYTNCFESKKHFKNILLTRLLFNL
jgi:hypothetical protein